MKVKIAKWGNSLGVRLPKAAAEQAGLKEGAEVDIVVESGELRLRSNVPFKQYRLEDLLAQIKVEKSPDMQDWSAVEAPWPDDDWSDIAPTDEEMGLGNAGGKRSRS